MTFCFVGNNHLSYGSGLLIKNVPFKIREFWERGIPANRILFNRIPCTVSKKEILFSSH